MPRSVPEAGEEVILRLFRSQDGNRGQYAESISGQEDNALSCRSCALVVNKALNGAFDVVDRIGYTGVFRDGLIGKVDVALDVEGYVFEQSVTLDGAIDVRFGFHVKVDNLSIAAAFEVEYAFIIPAVFVITNQQTFRVRGQGGFTRAGEAEEDSRVLALLVRVSGAVAEQCIAAMPLSGRK